MEPISITVTGKIGGQLFPGTTRYGKPMVSFSLAAYLPPRGAGRDGETRWFRVFAFDMLAENITASLVTGDRVTVRAADITARAYIRDSDPEKVPQGQVVLIAQDISASMGFETLTTAKAVRATAQDQAAADPADSEPSAEEQANLAVLAGVTRS